MIDLDAKTVDAANVTALTGYELAPMNEIVPWWEVATPDGTWRWDCLNPGRRERTTALLQSTPS